MKTSVQTWLSGRWAAGMGSAYWQALPMRSVGRLLAPAFILSCGFGFAIDLLLLNYQPLARGFFWPVYSGTLATATLAARIKRRLRLVPVLLLMTLAGLWLGVRISFRSPAPPDVEALKRRVVFDAIGILVGTVLGYRLLVDFSGPKASRLSACRPNLPSHTAYRQLWFRRFRFGLTASRYTGNPFPAQKWAAT